MDAGAIPLLAALLKGVKADSSSTVAQALKDALGALAALASHDLLRAALLSAVHRDSVAAVMNIDGIADNVIRTALLLAVGTFCDSGDEKVEKLFSTFDLMGRLKDLLAKALQRSRSSASLRKSVSYVACAAADRSRAEVLAAGPVPALLVSALQMAAADGDVAAQRAALRSLLTLALIGPDGVAALRKAGCGDAAAPLASSADAYVCEAAVGLLVRLGEYAGPGAKEARDAAAASSPSPSARGADAFVCCDWAEAADAARSVLNSLVVRGLTVCTDLFAYEEQDWAATIGSCRVFVLVLSGAQLLRLFRPALLRPSAAAVLVAPRKFSRSHVCFLSPPSSSPQTRRSAQSAASASSPRRWAPTCRSCAWSKRAPGGRGTRPRTRRRRRLRSSPG